MPINTSQQKNKILLKAFRADQKALREKQLSAKKRLFGQSLNLYKKILRSDPGDNKIWRNIARVELHRLRPQQALSAYMKGLKSAKKSEMHFFHNGLGNVSRYIADYDKKRQSDYEKTINFYQKAIKNAPRETVSLYWSNLSAAYAGLKKWNEAQKAAQKALTLLKQEEDRGIKPDNQIKILELEIKLYNEYKKRTLR